MAEKEIKKAKISVEFKTAEKRKNLVSGETINEHLSKIDRFMRDTQISSETGNQLRQKDDGWFVEEYDDTEIRNKLIKVDKYAQNILHEFLFPHSNVPLPLGKGYKMCTLLKSSNSNSNTLLYVGQPSGAYLNQEAFLSISVSGYCSWVLISTTGYQINVFDRIKTRNTNEGIEIWQYTSGKSNTTPFVVVALDNGNIESRNAGKLMIPDAWVQEDVPDDLTDIPYCEIYSPTTIRHATIDEEHPSFASFNVPGNYVISNSTAATDAPMDLSYSHVTLEVYNDSSSYAASNTIPYLLQKLTANLYTNATGSNSGNTIFYRRVLAGIPQPWLMLPSSANTFTGNKVLLSDGTTRMKESDVTATELGYLSGLTGNVQEQINILESQLKQHSWQEVQRIVRAGLAADVFPLGYEFTTPDSDTGMGANTSQYISAVCIIA